MVAVADDLKGRDFTKVADWSRDELLRVLDLADELKRAHKAGEEQRLLPGRTLGMIFQKPSTRTRVSFEVGMWQLGGVALYLSASDLQLGRGESVKDTALVLSRYLDAIMIRTFDQADVEELARNATIPVINGLTDSSHPCQALADAMTIRERLGRFEGVRLTYLGDGNNVCASLMVAAAKLGMHFTAAVPPGLRARRRGARRRAHRRRGDRRGRAGRQRRARGERGRRGLLHRRLDEHGPGRGARAPPARPRRLRHHRRAAGARRRRRDRAALPPRALRRGDHRRRSRTGRSRRSGTRPRTACTRRRLSWRSTVR